MTPAQTLTKIDPEDSIQKYASCSKSISGATYGMDLKCNENSKKMSIVETHTRRQVSQPGHPEDAKVDVAECSNMGSAARWSDSQDPDATEYSSSFSGTVSDYEHCSGLSDVEVESQMSIDNDLPSAFDVFDSMLHVRKKKLTNHWRNFIHPLMWRCKWTELRIKEIESQTLKYARELAPYEQDTHSPLDEYSAVEKLASKSLPFSGPGRNRKIMRRRKRKRVEEISDISSYMSHHHLFSYLENRRFDQEANYYIPNEVVHSDNTAEVNNIGATTGRASLESRQIDLNLEQILQKIEAASSRVHKLRNQLDIIMSQNALKFSSSENLSLLMAPFEEAQTSSAPSPASGNGDLRLVGPDCHPNYGIDNLVLPESVVSSFDEVVSIPDVIESTVGLLSAADATLHQPVIGDTTEDMVGSALIHDKPDGGRGMGILKTSASEPIARQHDSYKGDEQDESPDPSLQEVTSKQQSNIQPGLASDIHVPMNKRKRGERKSGNGGWNK
ncbi:hypothetical protein SAY87_000129 [Trapa incisa]|uniref:Uncharacterized protein n=1 Tax=Trapa incisa TaxID=236973 RepID=A0AAN7GLT8_9MYRT|nr:hypothetical protein SAY87_000129 [Trapa incisa]